jgi:hypothetical protein
MKQDQLPRLFAARKTGKEVFHTNAHPIEHALALHQFWQWAASNLVDNTFRGWLAEFIVASALGITDGIRNSWDKYDLKTPSDLTIQVKCSAYLQSWYQDKYSMISFDVEPKRAFNPDTNTLEGTPKYHSDLFVFCLHKHKDKQTIDPMDLDQWTFYVLPTKTPDEKVSRQKTIGLSTLLKLHPIEASYSTLKNAVESFQESAKIGY